MAAYDFSNLGVLIVEDNHNMAVIIRTLLKGFGIQRIYQARDAAEALQALAMHEADVLVVDYILKGLDGIELTSLIRTAEDSPNRYIPIIMISAHSERSKIEAALDAGVHEFLRKPISAKSLYLRMVEVIERPRPFVSKPGYFGPERRQRRLADVQNQVLEPEKPLPTSPSVAEGLDGSQADA